MRTAVAGGTRWPAGGAAMAAQRGALLYKELVDEALHDRIQEQLPRRSRCPDPADEFHDVAATGARRVNAEQIDCEHAHRTATLGVRRVGGILIRAPLPMRAEHALEYCVTGPQTQSIEHCLRKMCLNMAWSPSSAESCSVVSECTCRFVIRPTDVSWASSARKACQAVIAPGVVIVGIRSHQGPSRGIGFHPRPPETSPLGVVPWRATRTWP